MMLFTASWTYVRRHRRIGWVIYREALHVAEIDRKWIKRRRQAALRVGSKCICGESSVSPQDRSLHHVDESNGQSIASDPIGT